MENTWEYDREKIEFDYTKDLIDKLNELGNQGWEVIHYDETPPPKFGDRYEAIVLMKKQKS
jgi:hypothetical protein